MTGWQAGEEAWVAMTAQPSQVVLANALRRAGFRVERLQSPVDLRARLEAACPDLLLLDRGVLEAVRDELTRRLRAAADIPALIAVSDQWAAGDLANLRTLGAELVSWPVQAANLLQTVRRLLASRSRGKPPRLPDTDILICGFGAHASLLAEELTGAGFRVRCAADGRAAEITKTGGGFRSLLLDLQVAGLDRVLQSVAALAGRRPILAVGRMGCREADWLRQVEAVTFLEKPLRLPELLAVVTRLLAAAPRPRGEGEAA